MVLFCGFSMFTGGHYYQHFTMSAMLHASLLIFSSALLFGPGGSRGQSQGLLPECAAGEFRSPDLIGPRCLPCSRCPRNHIVRRPCAADSDTVCGPFYEFEFFNQHPSEGGDDLPEAAPRQGAQWKGHDLKARTQTTREKSADAVAPGEHPLDALKGTLL